MNPAQIRDNYDVIAQRWQTDTHDSYGIAALERAIGFCKSKILALDVGCGSHGRYIETMRAHGFQTEGIDISSTMIDLARQRSPETVFYNEDICTWKSVRTYDLITAWDSTFHLPLDSQVPVLSSICRMLNSHGVLLFTGGSGPAVEITGTFHGLEFGYSTLGVNGFVKAMDSEGVSCFHVEHDQFPEGHVVFIGVKT